MEVAKKNQLTPVEKVSQNDIVQTLAVKQFDQVSSQLPKKIQGTFELPKIREMILATGEKTVQGFIEFELIKLAERINVSGNLTDGQVEFIASQLIGLYPNETIADFKICFEKGAYGAYGKIFKLDGVEIGNWFKAYLDEKYQVMESELMKEKDEFYKKPIQNTDWLQLWKEAVEKTDSENPVKTRSTNSFFASSVKALTDKEIKDEGQPTPKYKPYPQTQLSEIQELELHRQYIRENYDTYTGKPKTTWIEESNWRENLPLLPQTREVLHSETKVQEDKRE